MIGVGMLGAGFIADYHARAVAACAGMELCAVAGGGREKTRAFAARHGVGNVHDSAAGLLADPAVEAVVVATPNVFHAPYTLKALEQGKHVLVEKPMAVTVAEAEAMGRAAAEAERRLMVGHMWRFDNEVNYARRLVASGKLGRIYRGTAYGVHENWGPSGWFLDPELSGGGALVDMGVHAIDTIRYILGDPRPLSVYARIGSERPEYTVDDSGILMVVWEGGISTVIYSGWWQAHAEAPEAGVRLWGSEGFLSVFPTRFKTMIAGSPGECTPVLPPREEHCGQVLYNAQMESFCGSISGGGPAHPGSGEGLTVMRIVAAAYASAAGGGVVALAGGAGTA